MSSRAASTPASTSSLRAMTVDLNGVVERWVGLDPDTVAAEDIGDLLVTVDRAVNRLLAAKTTLTASFARRQGFRASGHKDAQHWLQDTLRQSFTQARKQAQTANRLHRGGLDATKQALAEGKIGFDHAAAIADAAHKLQYDAQAEGTLLAAASSGDERQVRQVGRRLAQRADAEAARRQARRAWEQRNVSFKSDGAGSVFIDGRLHQLGGEVAMTALNALAAPTGADDDRTHGQRMADALIELCERATRLKGLPDDGGLPPQVLLTVPVETVEQRAGVPAGTLAWTGPTPPPLLEQLLCDAELDWLLTGDGNPLYQGRTRRDPNKAQRRALHARDGGCRWPGCSTPGAWCLAHHATYWDPPHAGTTDIDNLILVCQAHHNYIHHGRWKLRLDPDGTVTVTSPGTSVTRSETATTARARHHHGAGIDQPPDEARAGPDDPSSQRRAHPPTLAGETRATYRVRAGPAPPSRRSSRPSPTTHARPADPGRPAQRGPDGSDEALAARLHDRTLA